MIRVGVVLSCVQYFKAEPDGMTYSALHSSIYVKIRFLRWGWMEPARALYLII